MVAHAGNLKKKDSHALLYIPTHLDTPFRLIPPPLRQGALFSAKTPILHIVGESSDDDKFIECGVALKAEAIISGDKTLLAIEGYMGIRILSPKEFIKSFMGNQ